MKNFSGIYTALVTPFLDQKIDTLSLKSLVNNQIDNGVNGFVVNGTTAESPTLLSEEKVKIFETVKNTNSSIPIIMGTGSNSTAKTIIDSKQAEKLGADAVLVVVPYYNKPPQKGLFEHFKAVAESVSIPIILYNVPSRTVTSLELETIHALSQHPNIIGIKEATGNIPFAKDIRKKCGDEFILLSGDDGSYDNFMEEGGDGAISVASHVIPKAMINKNASKFKNLIDLLFCEANPIPVKMALYLMGLIKSPELRLPLVTMSNLGTEKLKIEMKRLGLLN